MLSRSTLFVIASTLAVCAGCGEKRDSASVFGKITVGGKPLPDLGVNFEPIGSGAGRGSFGRTDASGSYTLRFIDNDQPGALIGKHQVTFRDLQASSAQESDAGSLPPQKFRFPKKYLTETLEFEVKPGTNEANFDLR